VTNSKAEESIPVSVNSNTAPRKPPHSPDPGTRPNPNSLWK
jgi:hypothetical protein